MQQIMSQNFDGAIPFEEIQIPHYEGLIDKALERAIQRRENLKRNKQIDFESVLSALETMSEELDFISGIFMNMVSIHGVPQMHEIAQKISPKLACYQTEITLDESIFAQVKALFDSHASLSFSAEQKMLLKRTYDAFIKNGALLDAEKKSRLKTLNEELSKLSPQFSENVMKATAAFHVLVTDAGDLEGLPPFALESAKGEAEKRGHKDGYVFTLQAPSYLAVMQYARSEKLRKKIWLAFGSRSFGDAHDNQETILNIVKLRRERAELLGFENHAAFVLQDRMAKTPEQVIQFLEKLYDVSLASAKKDLQSLQPILEEQKLTDAKVEPWNVLFLSEKLKEQKYQFSSEELRPYFQLENVIQGVFTHAGLLYDLNFRERPDLPVFHAEAKVFEVTKKLSGDYIGLLYMDLFPRDEKSGGAWMTSFREQGLWQGQVRRPHIAIICNFTRPTKDKPSLLTYDEVNTLFHEFGHALHGLLSRCNYRSLSGTNVLWDFVELPSQIMENWIQEKESLDLFARHYQTGEKIPAELVQKIKNSSQFFSGYTTLRQVSLSLLDMHWHMTETHQLSSVPEFEKTATERTRLFPFSTETNTSSSFSHIFAGGYSAGYYSYKWAEVLDADAFEFFKEKGIFNSEVASLFEKHILSRGGSDEPMELYKSFRGREPDPNALLRRSGLLGQNP